VFTRKEAASLKPQIIILCTQAADQASLLADMAQAYTAMEKLMTHGQRCASACLHAVSVEIVDASAQWGMERQVEGLVSLTSVLCTHVTDRIE